MPPKKEGICDFCGSKLFQRADDNEETIEKRLKVYAKDTLSLIDYYQKQDKLMQTNANDDAEVVMERILGELKSQRIYK